MGGKVIKINLVGAILTILLIIAAIIGIVVLVNKPKENNKENNEEKKQTSLRDKNEYTELDVKENIEIDGDNKEIMMRKLESKQGFTMNYDVDSFYVDEQDEKLDLLKSLISDTVEISITQANDSYNDLYRVLNANVDIMKEQYNSYQLNQTMVDERNCLIEEKKKDDTILKTYFVKREKGYYEIKVTCGEKFKNEIFPVIDKMIQSMKIS